MYHRTVATRIDTDRHDGDMGVSNTSESNPVSVDNDAFW
jgi:hypothetical protein